MARMIPPFPGSNCPPGEQLLFQRLADDPDTEGWVVLHSLHLAQAGRQVEGEVDFVVLVPGLGVLCLEVKSHRSARRDADGLWWLGNDPPTHKSPFDQASRGTHSLMAHLRMKRLDLAQVPFWSAVWFTGAAANVPDCPEWHSWQLLDRQDLRRPVSASIRAVFVRAREHLSAKRTSFDPSLAEPSPALVSSLAQQLRPKFELALSPREAQQERAQERMAFVVEQYEALDVMEDEPRALFSGPAGTGKTFLAVEAARRASLRGERVLLACYNKLLGRHLAAEFGDDELVAAGTLHKHMVTTTGLSVPPAPQDSWWAEELPERALEALLADPPEFDLLVVDEAQDLCSSPEYLDVLDASVKGGLAGGRWLMFGDFERQVLYGLADGRKSLADRCAQFARPKLSHNCRNTPQIGSAAAQLAKVPRHAYRGYRRRDDGIQPEYWPYRDEGDQERLLLKALQELEGEHYAGSEVVVLSAVNASVAATATDGALRKRLRPYGQPGKQVPYSTVHAFKGLDAPAVIVTDIEEVDGAEAEAVLYVALTRAADRLYLLVSERAMRPLAQAVLRKAGNGA